MNTNEDLLNKITDSDIAALLEMTKQVESLTDQQLRFFFCTIYSRNNWNHPIILSQYAIRYIRTGEPPYRCGNAT
ncbi:MAG: hypothetical protein LBG17_05080 [Bacteroidales bacterium]|jgi:hypothetical protein|nr:hypothetical protein [Bacteroidales bacterium]